MSRKRPPGKLTPEDRETWGRVAKTLTPIGKPKIRGSEIEVGLEQSLAPEIDHGKPVRPRKANPIGNAPPKTAPAKTNSSYELDGRTFDRLRKGKIKPDRRIDLHGMTAARAHAALKMFVSTASADGCRMILVITGKGSRSLTDDPTIPVRRGVIRESLPQWLAMPPLRGLVLQFHQAQLKDGGGGAFYVYLRRRR